MIQFLKQVAAHYFEAGDIDRRFFIFPNRRSMVFFSRYLSEEVARASAVPLLAPEMMTVNDFMSRLGGLQTADKVHQLVLLYDCYRKLNPKAEPLDDFIFWGDVLLGDFDDVDKYLADPRKLFSNIADLKSIQDDMTYLTDGQRKALERFLRHFDQNVGAKESDYKDRFLQIWEIMHSLYVDFGERLRAEGLAYEGMIYRDIVERITKEPVADILAEHFPRVQGFVFVGLNALNECERRLMTSMQKAGLAEFCWDYGSDMIRDEENRSSFFMRDNLARFPQAFRVDAEEPLPDTEFNVLSVPSATGQAKQLPEIFRRIGVSPGLETAVVLPEEELLIPVMNSIPEDVRSVNVTMGYSMANSAIFQLLGDVASMQLKMRCNASGEWSFYHKPVWEIFSNSVFKSVINESEAEIVSNVRGQARYYIPQADLTGGPVLDAIFRPVVTAPEASGNIAAIESYQLELVRTVAVRLREHPALNMELDFARDCYSLILRLSGECLELRPSSYFSLFCKLASGMSVPFRGEPLKGLQIMGPLETRALDFDNIIILSCNEGMFPRHSVSGSFIPAELRRGFGLPTYEFQDAVWAYYFYRMIQRASKVWLVYDSRSDMGRSGEESRYIKQLQMHFGKTVHRYVSRSSMAAAAVPEMIPKTAEDLEIILSREFHLSASSLKNYISCPARFYYSSIRRLKGSEEVVENMDGSMIGNALHRSMEELYGSRKFISTDYLQSCIGNEELVKNVVRRHVLDELGMSEVRGRNLIYEDMVRNYVTQVMRRDLELLHSEGIDRFEILGLEKNMEWQLGGFRFTGQIDRLDSLHPGTVRVVDYKTGAVHDSDTDICDANADKIVEALYGTKEKDRPKIAFQIFLYDMFVASDPEYRGMRIQNSVYQTNSLFKNAVENVDMSQTFSELMTARLGDVLAELRNPDIGFRRAVDEDACTYCDFKKLCGK